jgi:endo-1,4-beta-xylanase
LLLLKKTAGDERNSKLIVIIFFNIVTCYLNIWPNCAYKQRAMKKVPFIVVITVCILASCSKNNSTTGGGTVTPPIVLEDTSLQKMVPFPIGAAISVGLMQNNARYNAVVKKEFSSITCENAMKFAGLHSSQTSFNFTDADYLVSFAQQNNKRIHGHTLVWHQSLPSWVTNFLGDSTAWENLLKTHIQTVVTHFKGKVTSWDVVNEAFNDDGTLRNSIWRTKLGDDYIARCFQYANEADPAALLFYNDYGHEYSVAKRNAIVAMLSSFKTRGIPVNGIGMQFHMTVNTTDANISAALNAAVATGLKVHIAELDIKLNTNTVQGFTLTSALADQQAAKYKYVVKTYNAIPAAQKFGITTWNVSDADSWIPSWQGAPDFPLPFDVNYSRKPAYYGIIDGAK